MFKFLFKIAVRNIWKNKFVFFINTIGFSISLTVCIILFLWINRQYEYNRFVPKEDGVHEILTNYTVNGNIQTASATSYPIIEKISENIPEAEQVAFFQLSNENRHIKVGNNNFSILGYQGSQNFFKIFERPFLFGTPDECLNDPFSIVLSETSAVKILGDNWMASIENQTILLNGWKPVEVRGVFKDFPATSTIQFDFIFPFMDDISDHIGNYSYKAFIKLGLSNAAEVENKINLLIKSETSAHIVLQPFRDTYLFSNFQDGRLYGGRIDYVIIFIVAALFVLSMALINFVNLYIASSIHRSKELGLRRIIGEERHFQKWQLIIETYFITFLSTLVALCLGYLLLPIINSLFGINIDFPFHLVWFWIGVFFMFMFTGLIASFYPVSVLTSFEPVTILSGRRGPTSGFTSRKFFLIVQFFLSVLLTFFSYGISGQLSYLKNKDLGFQKENVLCYPLPTKLTTKTELIKSELQSLNYFESISFCSSDLLSGSPMIGGLEWPDKDPTDSSQFGVLFVDMDFLATMNIEVISGSITDEAYQHDVPVVMNSKAAQKMGGQEKILNQPIKVWGSDAIVKGIIKDFHFNTLFNPIQPLIIAVLPSEAEYMFAKVKEGMELEAIQELSNLHQNLDENSLFSYFWLEDRIENIYQEENKINNISRVFSILSLVISSLGLFALANLNAKKRIREFAIRRVLGSTPFQLLKLMILEYLKLIIISTSVALPVAYYLLNLWLQKFAYSSRFLNFSLIGVIIVIMVVVIVAVLANAIKAIRTNPATSLRNE